MKRYILLFLFICSFLSCNAQSNRITKDDEIIISKIIDKFSYPMPPPPPIGTKDTVLPDTVVDSLLKVKMTVGIYPLMEGNLDENGRNRLPKRYAEIINTSLKQKKIKSVNRILSEKKHTIKLADITELKKSMNFKNYDLLYHFSRIWYNNDRTMAIFEVGISRSRLNGYSTIFCMEKSKNEWSIVESFSTTMW